MSPGKILNCQGNLVNHIKEAGSHGGAWGGEKVLIIESHYQPGGLDMVRETGRIHLSPGKTIGFDGGCYVVPEDETADEFSRRYQVNSKYIAINQAEIRACFPNLSEREM